ncbi:MAG: hypothetical protein OXE95_11835 [Chloroflexi bacterium]|nr:hypothetical protein [Chloroflexota bacterium]MCY4248250.1 hypothetical protein [Chloroflexota bacterium]
MARAYLWKLREKSHMRPHRLRIVLLCLLLSGCGNMAMPTPTPGTGSWTLEYAGDCQAREPDAIQITRLDEQKIAFDDFRLLRDETGHYTGSASFIAPMPADGREIGYIISYRLQPAADGYVGQQLVVEGGGHGIACPVKLAHRGE